VIYTYTTPAVQAARSATSTIPIVFVGVADPVGLGLVKSLAHPGGNITGISTQLRELSAKYLQLLRELLPNVSRATVIWNPANVASERGLRETEALAPALGIQITALAVRASSDLETVFAILKRERPDALLVHPTPPDLRRASSHNAVRGCIATPGDLGLSVDG
jgi:putative ABC transport system substrate-binding protein